MKKREIFGGRLDWSGTKSLRLRRRSHDLLIRLLRNPLCFCKLSMSIIYWQMDTSAVDFSVITVGLKIASDLAVTHGVLLSDWLHSQMSNVGGFSVSLTGRSWTSDIKWENFKCFRILKSRESPRGVLSSDSLFIVLNSFLWAFGWRRRRGSAVRTFRDESRKKTGFTSSTDLKLRLITASLLCSDSVSQF